MTNIEEEIKYFKKNVPDFAKIRDEYIFTLVCSKYYYYDGEINYSTVDNIFVDGSNDGGIDLIFNNPNSENEDLILVQGKYSSKLDREAIFNAFIKMDLTIRNIERGFSEKYNEKLKSSYRNCSDNLGENGNIELVLFTASKLSKENQRNIEMDLENYESLKDYIITIYYLEDIEGQIQYINKRDPWVQEDKIKFDKESGLLKFNENGLLINISGYSLKLLYEKYQSKGLFDLNLRKFISNKKVDSGIKNTLKNNRRNFWYLNNGITIGCNDFTIDGNIIKLYNFSIINGAQTTTLISKSSNGDQDFLLPCKIIKAERNLDEGDFITEIAEASNSQKPINSRDLKANRFEQKKLRQELLKHETPVYLEIKRGEKKPIKSKYSHKWQLIKNDLLGQLILSIIFQNPGTARSSKNSIFEKESLYNKIFQRSHDFNTLVDIIKLNFYYENFLEKGLKEQKFDNKKEEDSIAKNGKFFVLAIIGFFIKVERNLFKVNHILDDTLKSQLQNDNINATIIDKYRNDNFESLLNELFYKIILNLSDLYDIERSKNSTNSVSNFFKSDKNYIDNMLPHIIKRIYYQETNKEEYKKKYFVILDKI